MRKHLLFALVVLVATMLGVSSCKKKDNSKNTDLPTTSQGAQDRLTGDEQVKKLNQLGEQMLGCFKTQEQKDLIVLTDYLVSIFEDANWSAVLDSAGSGHASYQGKKEQMAALRRLAVNAYYAPMDFMDIVKPDNWYAKDFFGEYEFVDSSKKWRFTAENANAAVFRCQDGKGDNVVITFKAGGDAYSVIDTVKVYDYNTTKRIYTVDYWDEKSGRFIEGEEISTSYYQQLLDNRDDNFESDDYFTATFGGTHYYVHVSYPYTMQPVVMHLPSSFEAVLTDNNVELINVALTFDINRKDHFKVAGNVRLANVVQKYDMNITRNAARGNYELTVGGKQICKLALDNTGVNALAIDPNNNLRSEEDLEKYMDKFRDEFKPGKTNVLLSLLGGEMSLKGEVLGDAYYAGMKKIQDRGRSGDRESAEMEVENWNENVLMFVYYGSDIKQAQIVMTADGNDTDGSYSVVPAIYFIEDKVTMQFDQYFTRRSYGDLLDATESLINAYIEFFKELKIEPVDL